MSDQYPFPESSPPGASFLEGPAPERVDIENDGWNEDHGSDRP
jgi:hypothetical protein